MFPKFETYNQGPFIVPFLIVLGNYRDQFSDIPDTIGGESAN